MAIEIDHKKCMHCAGCVSVCPVMALELEEGRIEYDEEKCIGCGACIKVCPVGAIKEKEEEE